MNEHGKETVESVIETAALRFEMKLSEEIGGVKTGMDGLRYDVDVLKKDVSVLKADVAGLKTTVAGLKTDINELKADFFERLGKVREEMQRLQVSTVRWMFIFWVGQIGVLFGIIYAVFK